LADLYLARACIDGDAAALKTFESKIIPEAGSAIRGVDSRPDFVDEVRQRVRAKLLVGTHERPPRIADYSGRGTLAAWVTVTAVRVGLTFLRETQRANKYKDERWVSALVLPEVGDPELDHLKERYRTELQQALTRACADLEDRERTVMRLYFMEGLSIDKIGKIYGVHRATIARWIAKSRERLFDRTRAVLIQDMALPPEELSSLDRLVRSQLDVSLGGLLG
jgi:RNA polymerase sigma-70 factor (ECF subfamily)